MPTAFDERLASIWPSDIILTMTPLRDLDPDHRAMRLRLDLMFWHRDFSEWLMLFGAAAMVLASFTRFGPAVGGLWIILSLGYIVGTGDSASERTYWLVTLGAQLVVGIVVGAAIVCGVFTTWSENRLMSLQARPIEAGPSDNWEVTWLDRPLATELFDKRATTTPLSQAWVSAGPEYMPSLWHFVGSDEIKKTATFETYDVAVTWAIANRDLDLYRQPMLNCFTDDTPYGGPHAPWFKYFDYYED